MCDMNNDCHEEHAELKGAVRSVCEQLEQVDKRLITHTSEVHQTLVERSKSKQPTGKVTTKPRR